MRHLKRFFILLVVAGFVGPVAACESPTLPPLPPEEQDKEPDETDPGDQTGFLQFPDVPLILV